MFDLFGNVFGRSKKSSSGHNQSPSASTTSLNHGNDQEQDGFLFLGQTSTSNDGTEASQAPLYPTMLTDDMLRSPPSQTSATANTWDSHYNQPFSSTNNNNDFRGIETQMSYSTPIDNIEFTPTNSANIATHQGMSEFGQLFETVDRIGTFLSTTSQSGYNFSLENQVLRESIMEQMEF